MHLSTPSTRTRLSVTSLAQYIKMQNCDRYLRSRLFPEEDRARREKWDVTIQPLTPLLKEEGFKFEEKVVEAIAAAGEPVVDLSGESTDKTLEWLTYANAPVIL